MKEKIHPKWFEATVVCSCGNTFTTGSTREKLHVEICSACHPFFTGNQKFVDTEGRVEKFMTKYGTVTSKKSKKDLAKAEREKAQAEAAKAEAAKAEAAKAEAAKVQAAAETAQAATTASEQVKAETGGAEPKRKRASKPRTRKPKADKAAASAETPAESPAP